ncbi:hypothetical protein [Chitinimonas koreensis]|uniref:hypothetical protein n=1 Tax=Chitinimonas koreensis TaxID=356302 RepID=UPI0003FB45A7|nr:hypothetical protein [Chitinimonas koreensis]QNM96874.1 hypothetical protein H9L41_00510 [Chitinimonas koreensis]
MKADCRQGLDRAAGKTVEQTIGATSEMLRPWAGFYTRQPPRSAALSGVKPDLPIRPTQP